MISADNHTENQDFPALRGLYILGQGYETLHLHVVLAMLFYYSPPFRLPGLPGTPDSRPALVARLADRGDGGEGGDAAAAAAAVTAPTHNSR